MLGNMNIKETIKKSQEEFDRTFPNKLGEVVDDFASTVLNPFITQNNYTQSAYFIFLEHTLVDRCVKITSN